MYNLPPKLLSQIHEKQYSTTTRVPSITNRQSLFVREIMPHLDQPSTISSNMTTKVNDDPEITELTQEAFIASTRANRRLSRENTTKEVDDRTRSGVQKRTRFAKEVSIREVSDKDNRDKGKGKEVVVEKTVEDKEKEADKENRDKRDEEQTGKWSRELTVVGDGPPPQPPVVSLLPRNEQPTSGSRPSQNAVDHPFANVRDGYAPPVARNLGALLKPVRNRDTPSYQNVAPIIANNPSVMQAMLE